MIVLLAAWASEAVDVRQLHPATNALLGRLSLSARPPHPLPERLPVSSTRFLSPDTMARKPQPFWSGRLWLIFWWSVAFHWQLLGQQPRQPATAACAFPRGCGSICPHNGRWSQASQTLWCHRTPARFSCAIIPFLLFKAQWRAIRTTLPGNFLAHTERASKGVLGKLLAWPPDYIGPMRDDVVLKRRKMSSW